MSLKDGVMTGGNRFQSVQVGLEIPLFGGAQRAKIKSARAEAAIIQNESDYANQLLKTELTASLKQYEQFNLIVSGFEKDALKNARAITATLTKQLQNGEINFIEWTILNQQSLNIQLDYFEAVTKLNQTIIQLNYLLSK